jgi:hypothetical protein
MYLTGHPGMALDPYVTSMYPTGYPSFALDPYVTSMYLTGHSSMGLDPSMGTPAWAWSPPGRLCTPPCTLGGSKIPM